jgi:uncharacterized membrane protein HdeD (DUF308 family)
MEASRIEVVDETELVAELKKSSGPLMAIGVIALIAGIVCIFVPAVASLAIGIFIGWILIFAGVLGVVDAFAVREKGRVALRLLGAAITAGIGIWVLTSDYKGTFTLTVILGIWFFAGGAIKLIAGIRERGTPGAGVLVLNGVLSLILGGLILADLPSSASWAIGLLVGVDLIFAGFALIATASAAKRL